MSFIIASVFSLFIQSAHAELYEKPKYVPDEGHIKKEVIQKQEERVQEKIEKKKPTSKKKKRAQ